MFEFFRNLQVVDWEKQYRFWFVVIDDSLICAVRMSAEQGIYRFILISLTFISTSKTVVNYFFENLKKIRIFFFFRSETFSAKLRDVIGQMDGMLESEEGCVDEEEADRARTRKVSRLELNVKKDSGYGSQGLIAVDQVFYEGFFSVFRSSFG